MKSSIFYIPSLQWKQSEMLALRELRLFGKGFSNLIPLIEVHPDKLKDRGKTKGISIVNLFSRLENDIKTNWGIEKFYLDLQYLQDEKLLNTPILISDLINNLLVEGYNPVLTTGLHPPKNIVDSNKLAGKLGLCLRLTLQDCLSDKINQEIIKFQSLIGIEKPSIDLIIDYQFEVNANYGHVLSAIQNITDFRSVTILKGSFPVDLSHIKPGIHSKERTEWLDWTNFIQSNNSSLKINFGDYTIQHPIHRELPDKPLNVSASIRYALENKWLIFRGEGLFHKGSKGHSQYPAIAKLLMMNPEYLGEKYSYGSNYIYTIGSENKKNRKSNVMVEGWYKSSYYNVVESNRQFALDKNLL